MKVKIFNSTKCAEDVENKIADWTKDLNPEIHDVKLTITPMHDLYDTGQICNRWTEYMAAITYSLKHEIKIHDEQPLYFKDAAIPLIKFMANNYHPHSIAIVTSTGAELLESLQNTGKIMDFIKD